MRVLKKVLKIAAMALGEAPHHASAVATYTATFALDDKEPGQGDLLMAAGLVGPVRLVALETAD